MKQPGKDRGIGKPRKFLRARMRPSSSFSPATTGRQYRIRFVRWAPAATRRQRCLRDSAVNGLNPFVCNPGPGHQNGKLQVGQALKPLDVFAVNVPTRDDEDRVCETVTVPEVRGFGEGVLSRAEAGGPLRG